MIAYKFLGQGAVGHYSGFSWPRPTGDRAGAWVEADGPLRPAAHGIHACRPDQLPYWLDKELWEAELAEPVEETERALISKRGRLLQPIDAWTEDVAREFVANCGERSRSHATAALVAFGAHDQASALDSSDDPEQFMAAAVSAAEQVSEPVTTILLDSADVAFATHGGMSVCLVGYLSARVSRAAAEAKDESVIEADRSERQAQADWLADRLQLRAS